MTVTVSNAAFELDIPGPQSQAQGGAGVACSADGWAILRNPALAADEIPRVGLCWSQEFGLPELARETIAASYSIHGQPFGVRASNFGTDLYREGQYGIILARRIRPDLSIGAELAAYHLGIESYSGSTAAVITLGMMLQPTKSVSVAAVWRNLNRPRMPGYEDRIAQSLAVGIRAQLGMRYSLLADLVQDEHFPVELRIGADAMLLKNFHLYAGMRAEPMRPSAGFRIIVGRWSVLYAGDLHPDLGPSHTLGLDLRLGK